MSALNSSTSNNSIMVGLLGAHPEGFRVVSQEEQEAAQQEYAARIDAMSWREGVIAELNGNSVHTRGFVWEIAERVFPDYRIGFSFFEEVIVDATEEALRMHMQRLFENADIDLDTVPSRDERFSPRGLAISAGMVEALESQFEDRMTDHAVAVKPLLDAAVASHRLIANTKPAEGAAIADTTIIEDTASASTLSVDIRRRLRSGTEENQLFIADMLPEMSAQELHAVAAEVKETTNGLLDCEVSAELVQRGISHDEFGQQWIDWKTLYESLCDTPFLMSNDLEGDAEHGLDPNVSYTTFRKVVGDDPRAFLYSGFLWYSATREGLLELFAVNFDLYQVEINTL